MFVYNLFAQLLRKPELKHSISIQTSARGSIHDIVNGHLRPLVLLVVGARVPVFTSVPCDPQLRPGLPGPGV
jgi:hypothetical protein